MKTRYRFIHFTQLLDGKWVCVSNSKPPTTELGFCEYFAPWRMWQYCPEPNTGYTTDCLRDIAHFMEQLPKP